MAKLSGINVAVLVTDGVEESELFDTIAALRAEDAAISVISPSGQAVQVMRHDEKTRTAQVQARISEANPRTFDAVLLPGGTMNADHLRMDEDARRFIRNMDEAGKPIAAICHAPWLLVSAGLVKGRTLTSYYTLQDDVRNAGGEWVDREVVQDGNWITSRNPDDIPAFNQAMIERVAAIAQPG